MGAKKEGGEKKPADGGGAGGEKKDDANVISVYNIYMHCHCQGCVKTVKDVVKDIDGVEDVKIDCAGNKLTVTGKVDPVKVKERLAEKTKKEVEIVSPQPKKDGGGGGKKANKKAADKKPAAEEEEKKPPKEKEGGQKKLAVGGGAKVISVYEMDMHCEGCAKKVKDFVKLIDGVEDVKIDCAGNKLTVTGKVDPTKVKERLEEKTKKKVKIVSPQPKKGEWAQAKTELQQERDNVTSLRSECEQSKKNAERKVEEMEKELANALHAVQAAGTRAAAAEMRAAVAKEKFEVELKKHTDDEKRVRDEVHHLSESVCRLQGEWAQAKTVLQQERDNVTSLRSECEQTKKNLERKVEEMEKKLANALHAVQAAETRAAAAAVTEACPICLINGKDMAFNCGHMTCRDCGPRVSNCPICRRGITSRLRLFN